jgi:Ni2+-binding GTPase involved in maturation of urease and hydrogenase
MSKVRLIALTGFLGAGKTTTMTALARYFEARGETVALVTNDQGVELVDSAVVAGAVGLSAEVTGGCYCCRFEDLASVLEDLISDGRATVVTIEAVGSCTDLQSTVIRPLRKFYADQLDVAPLVTVVDPDRYRTLAAHAGGEDESNLDYLFDRQLAEADIIGVNKEDTLDNDQRRALAQELSERYPRASVTTYSAMEGRGLDALVDLLAAVPAGWDVEVDYDRYAAAEAALAWLNLSVELRATEDDGFGPATWVMTALETMAERCESAGAVIGHIKVRLTGNGIAVIANLVGDGVPRLASKSSGWLSHGSALINARVEMATGDLDTIVRKAIEAADSAARTNSQFAGDTAAFQPGYPVPVHRMTAQGVL